ncbi:MAG: hypothetical protein ACE5JS_06380 [Nitrospinota bacterium]
MSRAQGVPKVLGFVLLVILFATVAGGCGEDAVRSAEGGEQVTLKISGMT